MCLIFNCIGKLQGRHCEVGSEGSGTANPRADVQKSRIRPSIRVSLPRKAKPTEGEFSVNVVVSGIKMGGSLADICILNRSQSTMGSTFVSNDGSIPLNSQSTIRTLSLSTIGSAVAYALVCGSNGNASVLRSVNCGS